MVERGGKVRATSVETRSGEELQAHIRACVEAGSAIFSDELPSYASLGDDYDIINHAVEYVNGNTHTNTIENFWALLKRGLHGTYVSVEPFHLFRYNRRTGIPLQQPARLNDGDRFETAMRQIVGKRLTYAELTGKAVDRNRSRIVNSRSN